MTKRNYQPSASAQERRANLCQASGTARTIKSKMIENAKNLDEALAIECLPLNWFILHRVYKVGNIELKTFGQWKEAGYKLKKGAKDHDITIWGQPINAKAKHEAEDVETKEPTTIEEEFKMFPMCILYPKEWVETWEEYEQNKEKAGEEKAGTSNAGQDLQQNNELARSLKSNSGENLPILLEDHKQTLLDLSILVPKQPETLEDYRLSYSPEKLARVQAYQDRKESKADRYRELSEKNSILSTQRYENARHIGSFIPFGQPILVGHHSEARHRRDLKRIDDNMRKSIELGDKSSYYAGKAASVESNDAIYDDDPEALEKLKIKLAGMEKQRDLMKNANKVIRKKGLSDEQRLQELQKLGLSEAIANKLLEPDSFNGLGFAPYKLTNLGQNILRVKKRVEKLEKVAEQETTETTINGVQIIENVEANRVQLFFPAKPNQEFRTKLKKDFGFRWSRYNGCWQKHRSNRATYQAERVCNLWNSEYEE